MFVKYILNVLLQTILIMVINISTSLEVFIPLNKGDIVLLPRHANVCATRYTILPINITNDP